MLPGPGTRPRASSAGSRGIDHGKGLEPFFRDGEYACETFDRGFHDAGQYVVERSHFETRMTTVSGGASVSHAGTYIVISRLDADPLWRVERYLARSVVRG